jgi:hypothetical protein
MVTFPLAAMPVFSRASGADHRTQADGRPQTPGAPDGQADNKTKSHKLSERYVTERLIKEIKSGNSRSIKITSGEAGFLQRNSDLVDSIIESKKLGADVSLYYFDMQDKTVLDKFNDSGCKTISGKDYPKLHYILLDNFAYVHTHERYSDRFIQNNNERLALLKQDFASLVNGKKGPEQGTHLDEMKG